MNFEYNTLLTQQLYSLQNTLALSDFKFSVDSEQAFLKKKDLDPNTIYVLTRDLQNENQIGVDTQPVQILILTEQNSLDIAKAFFSEFAKKYNWKVYSDSVNKIWVKQQYSDPVVLSNFNTVEYGYHSVLYMSANLFIMYDVVDLRSLYIDGEEFTVLSFDLAYSMNPNTQQLTGAGKYISRSVKSVSTMALTITIPVVESGLITKILKILDEDDGPTAGMDDTTAYGGNEDFVFDFYLGEYHFEDKKFKLVSADFGAAVNDVPAVRLGFMR